MKVDGTISFKDAYTVCRKLESEIGKTGKVFAAADLDSDIAKRVANTTMTKVCKSTSSEFEEADSLTTSRWNDFGAFRELMNKYFNLGLSPRAPTSPGSDLIVRVAKGLATPAEQRFMREVSLLPKRS